MDLYIESKDGILVEDIYVCYQLTNVIDLEKLHDLGFSICLDEELAFRPSTEYLMVKAQYELLGFELEHFKTPIKFDKLFNWYDGFRYLRNFFDGLDPFSSLDYKLFDDASRLLGKLDRIVSIKTITENALEALIDFQVATTERDKLIWLFENQMDRYANINFSIPEDLSVDSCVTYESDQLQLIIDITGYEYVFDYFKKLDDFYEAMMEKYKPLPAHFENSKQHRIGYSLESYLTLHKVHLDLVESYGQNG
ncbi:hypothetical protein ESY86_17965 [Subsaximicrobium wynnwilliamsii]|uniref:Uncharacterized protein n=1 Tax=Subsaximicrobium wynnwilliamsii TaxID=291179 RepID=A0A5C6ZEG3_9FLAO|nr:hypothetical protein [Subsaximicrobium wynnwilliamsii]TXD81399.1 hypothetical protein ESY87_18180 [Subsaximicrobium wynnwilliamsii]TXD87115.1 hypothetical protein ESY86_17965 [Subsaximicrobium wynnwilliamsii]TXE00669.1 hypothetical protein ESY88_18635 [Subsaximicrobium wynnwilliamsii]